MKASEEILEGSKEVPLPVEYPAHCMDKDPIHHGLCPSCSFEIIRDARMFQMKLAVILDSTYVNRLTKSMQRKLRVALETVEADR